MPWSPTPSSRTDQAVTGLFSDLIFVWIADEVPSNVARGLYIPQAWLALIVKLPAFSMGIADNSLFGLGLVMLEAGSGILVNPAFCHRAGLRHHLCE